MLFGPANMLSGSISESMGESKEGAWRGGACGTHYGAREPSSEALLSILSLP